MSHSKKTTHIEQILKNIQPNSRSEAVGIIFKLATLWKEIVGKDMLNVSSPLSFSKGSLTIGLKDPTLIFECKNTAPRWVKKLNDSLGQKAIERVEFKLI